MVGGLAGVAVASMGFAGFVAESNVEAKENAAEPVLGRLEVHGGQGPVPLPQPDVDAGQLRPAVILVDDLEKHGERVSGTITPLNTLVGD